VVLVTATSEFLLADARAALRRRLADSDRTELSRAFAAWLLPEPELKVEFASLVATAAIKKGAQQDFQTVAILGYAAEAGVLESAQADALKQGLSRQAGREPFVDGVRMAFCDDAVGILGISLGVKVLADDAITASVRVWMDRFLKASYDMERTEEWCRCLLAAADRQLDSPQNLSIPPSAAIADVRTALVMRGVLPEEILASDDSETTLRLAWKEPQADLPFDRAMLRLSATEFVIRNAEVPSGGKGSKRAAGIGGSLSERDRKIHDVIGKELFMTLTNAEIMKSAKKRLQTECQLVPGDAAKSSLDRIRQAKEYPLSLDIRNKRAVRNQTTVGNGRSKSR
jgi:hypothetical protein